MGCISSSSSDAEQDQRTLLSLAERKKQAKAKRRRAKSLVHNLVHDQFGRDISEFYDIDGDPLGEGVQGIVRVITHKTTGVKYAMKTVPKGAGKNSRATSQLRQEVEFIRSLDHPNIVRLQEAYETEESLFLVMDLCTGGDMMSRWERNQKLKYSENEAAHIIKKIVSAVRYCHDHHVVHRDLKLENLLWEHGGDDAEPQLADFGLSVTFAHEGDVFRDDVGSVYYVAPEVLGRNYTKACDCWSIGVISYMLLAGMPPFFAPTDEGIKLKIKWSRVNFPKERFENISEEAKDFIKRLLVKVPMKRMSAAEASVHPWITRQLPPPGQPKEQPVQVQPTCMGLEAREGNATDQLDPDIMRRLKRFGDFGALKRVAIGVIAHSLTPEEIKTLKAEFQKVDVEGRGEIMLSDFEKAVKFSGNYSTEEVGRMFAHMDVDQDGKIGFNEFVAASLSGEQVTNAKMKLAFDRMDSDGTGEVTFSDLTDLTGATVEEKDLEKEIKGADVRSALLGGGGGGVNYELFRRMMVKNFSVVDFGNSEEMRTFARQTSKLSLGELARAMDGTEEEAAMLKSTSHLILEKLAPSSEPVGYMEMEHADTEHVGVESQRGSVGDAIGLAI